MIHIPNLRLEPLSPALSIYVSSNHTFGTDAFLLADFAAPRKGETACDLGTGCGIIPLLWHRDGSVRPDKTAALDIQEEAIRLLRMTAERNKLEQAVMPVQGDLRERGQLPLGPFSLVTCNPPYQRAGSGMLSQTQAGKTARHETACTISDVCAAAAYLLRPGGRFCLCCRPQRLADVFEAMRNHHVEPKRLRFVQQRAASKPWLFLAEGRKGSRPFLEVLPPLLMDSEELRRIYQMDPGEAAAKERLTL